jgi:hypothetical protein
MRAGVLVGMLCVVSALPGGAAAQGLDTTCQFSLTRLDSTTTNVLAVDTNAVYWGGTYAALPGTRIRVEGQYPARALHQLERVRRRGAADRRALGRPARARPREHQPVPAGRLADSRGA